MVASKDQSPTSTFAIPLATYYSAALREEEKKNSTINKDEVKAILDKTTDQLNTAKGIMELHPDLNLAMEIRTSMILSPKDMMFQGLKLKLKSSEFSSKPKALEALASIEEHFRLKTSLEKDMATFIDEALFMYGAHIWLIIPPSSLDAYIQGGVALESTDSYIGANTLSLEDKAKERLTALGVMELTNNPNHLKLGELQRRIASRSRMAVSMESFGYDVAAYKATQPVAALSAKRDERANAHPLVFKVPVDSCLVVSEPNDPTHHLFHIIQVDENGCIVTNVEEANHFEELAKRLKTAINTKSGEDYQQLKKMGFRDEKLKANNTALLDTYSRFLETEIQSAIRDTAQDGAFTFEKNEAFYRTMFTRTMAKRKTRLLCVPAEMVDYMAFEYDSSGHGVSLLRKTQLYSSLRAVLMFSDLMRQVNNAVPGRDLNITLDEDERDPHAVVQQMIAEYGRLSDRSIPLGVFSPTTMMDELRRAGIRVNIDGGERFPNTKLAVEDRQHQRSLVESDLKEQLQRAQYAGIGVPPEAIDQTLQGDFAINTFTNNQLFAKRSMVDQTAFIGLMEQRMSKYIYLSNYLYQVVVDAVGEADAADFIGNLTLSLPTADFVRIEQQAEAYGRYADFIDRVMGDHISDAVLRGLLETAPTSEALEEIRANIAGHFKRQYLIRENILPEMQVLYSDDASKALSKQLGEYHDVILNTVGDFIKDLMKSDHKMAKKLDKQRAKLEEEPDEESGLDQTAPTVPMGNVPSEDGTPPEEEGDATDLAGDLPEPLE